MFDRVKAIIIDTFTVPAEKVTESVTLEELGLNSLDMVEFAELATERIGVPITDDEVIELESLERITALLESRQQH